MTTSQQMLQKWTKQGVQLEAEGSYDNAIAKYEIALKFAKPGSPHEQLLHEKIQKLKGHAPIPTHSSAATTEVSTAHAAPKPNVSWDDVAGLQAVKTKLRMIIELPGKQPQLFPPSQHRRGTSLLLYGPAGTGKTLLSKAIATAASGEYFSITSGNILSKYMGENEKQLRDIFQRARAGRNSVLFFDEIDSVATSRTSDESQAVRSLKTELLVQIDALLENPSVIFVAGTNAPWDLEPALLRRFSGKVYIPLPDHHDRRDLLRLELGRINHRVTDVDTITAATDMYSGSDLSQLIKVSQELANEDVANAKVFSIHPETGRYSIYIDTSAVAKTVETTWDQVPESLLDDNPVTVEHLRRAMAVQKPNATRQSLQRYEDWTRQNGMSGK